MENQASTMWKVLLTCVLAVSTPFIESCPTLHEVRAFKGESEPSVTLKFENLCTIPSNTFSTAADYARVDVISSDKKCIMIALTSDLFQNMSDLQELKLDCVRFTPASNSSNTKKWLRQLELSRTDLTESSKYFLTNYSPKLLKMMSVDIMVLFPDSFPGNYVESLVMKFNNMRRISDYSFVRFLNLKSLTIANNQISHLGSEMFSGLEKLTDLYLGQNEIATMEPNTFSEMPNLQSVFLSHNKLTIVPARAFKTLYSLRSLYLGYNNINNIGAEHLQGLGLTDLFVDLTCNNMTDSQKSELRGLHLRALDVWSCKHRYIFGK